MVFAARLTQRGHKIATMDDLMALYEKSFSEDSVAAISALPHPTVQKFAVITVAVVGASRRFLSQIIRHQNEVKFMSASLQYSNYVGQADFAIPYEILTAPASVRVLYLESCHKGMDCYEQLCNAGVGHDAAGYATPQGLRNVLVISATPYQWKHIIGQRVCRRNTDETRIVLLKIWQELYSLSPALFAPSQAGPFCQMDKCLEGKMTCGKKLAADMTPENILRVDYPALSEGGGA
ncbi:FAD-dependent thymidylate synthase [Anaerotruncus colihominis]|uniref:FAD-dependent thymidylate synthase n=2 Tax=Anaerotruncus colihominis TaxID=169435 RepID=A0A845SRH9_9FIRM|nr:FAD-dependent thymidylate synthase [Anaerotruncus colihominis]MCR2026683.1 FAD-dependent thymidylate synthase [Anaerotruncus colihominis]NDO38295.1 FAD-dependent thymidylate synthase [Anaerotruncus colihominis]